MKSSWKSIKLWYLDNLDDAKITQKNMIIIMMIDHAICSFLYANRMT